MENKYRGVCKFKETCQEYHPTGFLCNRDAGYDNKGHPLQCYQNMKTGLGNDFPNQEPREKPGLLNRLYAMFR